jgi:hypothetical protein
MADAAVVSIAVISSGSNGYRFLAQSHLPLLTPLRGSRDKRAAHHRAAPHRGGRRVRPPNRSERSGNAPYAL